MNAKEFFYSLVSRLQQFILKTISVSFLSWLLVVYLMKEKIVVIDGYAFIMFTASVMGLKNVLRYFEKKGGL